MASISLLLLNLPTDKPAMSLATIFRDYPFNVELLHRYDGVWWGGDT